MSSTSAAASGKGYESILPLKIKEAELVHTNGTKFTDSGAKTKYGVSWDIALYALEKSKSLAELGDIIYQEIDELTYEEMDRNGEFHLVSEFKKEHDAATAIAMGTLHKFSTHGEAATSAHASAAVSAISSEQRLPLYVDREDCYLMSRRGSLIKHTSRDADLYLKEAWEFGWQALRNSKSIAQAKNYIKRIVADYKRDFLAGLEGQSGYNATNHGNNNDDHFAEIRDDALKVVQGTLAHWKNQETYAEKEPKQAAKQATQKATNNTRRASRKARTKNMWLSLAASREEGKKRHTQNKFNAAIASGKSINLRSFARSLKLLKGNQVDKYYKIAEKQHEEKQAARKTKKNSPKKLSPVKENEI